MHSNWPKLCGCRFGVVCATRAVVELDLHLLAMPLLLVFAFLLLGINIADLYHNLRTLYAKKFDHKENQRKWSGVWVTFRVADIGATALDFVDWLNKNEVSADEAFEKTRKVRNDVFRRV